MGSQSSSKSVKRRVSFYETFVRGHEDKLNPPLLSTSLQTERCYDPQDATLTFVDGEDHLDFLCDNYKSLRAKMSCGHAATPTSLINWCRYLLDEGDSKFVCGQPKCAVEWPLEEVCKMALLTPEEIDDIEKKVFQNAAKDLDAKFCPGCKYRVMRTDLNILSVECTVCTAKRGRPYTFCWQCLKKWKGPAWSDHCGNGDCKSPLDILKSCPDITFEEVKGVTGCPSIRACPTCGFLVEHNRKLCKTIVCRLCKVKFCFVCLKLVVQCRTNPYKICPSGVAPRQTSIPVWKRK
ncbi:E3 ubiquitin-protein ligase RNF19B-like [Clinocottus analis]|uniref:E3 ubiquitin-protein ligase RNF19B-like n=1 Tax=Clinocottus analis TaxID=304258 RepID=UPI0035C0CF4A